MVGWHHWLDGHKFEQAAGHSEWQGILACFSPCGPKSQTWLNNNKYVVTVDKLMQSLKLPSTERPEATQHPRLLPAEYLAQPDARSPIWIWPTTLHYLNTVHLFCTYGHKREALMCFGALTRKRGSRVRDFSRGISSKFIKWWNVAHWVRGSEAPNWIF